VETRRSAFEGVLRSHLKYLTPDESLEWSASLVEIGLDSMEQIGLLIDLEEQFDIVFDDELLVAATFKSADALWRAFMQVLGSSGAG